MKKTLTGWAQTAPTEWRAKTETGEVWYVRQKQGDRRGVTSFYVKPERGTVLSKSNGTLRVFRSLAGAMSAAGDAAADAAAQVGASTACTHPIHMGRQLDARTVECGACGARKVGAGTPWTPAEGGAS